MSVHNTEEMSKEEALGSKSCWFPAGFAGTGPSGSFFESPAWVDRGKKPGMTSQEPFVAPRSEFPGR